MFSVFQVLHDVRRFGMQILPLAHWYKTGRHQEGSWQNSSRSW